ncbi:MAG: FAD-dependent oxidoreductase [Clostridiales bacterium]|nr:FAD-dependent oxidoreductase [Clostridiales bacterium]
MSLPIINAEVAVFGGGMAGVSASIAAARRGAKTVLIERFPQIGGMAGLIPISMWSIISAVEVGELEQNFGGIPQFFIDELKKHDAIEEVSFKVDGIDTWMADDGEKATARWYCYNPDVLKHIIFQQLEKEGVELRNNTLAVKTLVEDRKIVGVEVETLLQRELIKADIYIDATGSADIVHRAGIPTDYGSEAEGMIYPTATSWYVSGVDTKNLDIHEAIAYYQKKREAKELDVPLEGLSVEILSDGIVKLFGTRVFNVNPLDPLQAAYGEREQRRQIYDIYTTFKEGLPEFKNSRIINTGSQLGASGTRRIQGEYKVKLDELMKGVKFEDVIATGTYRLEYWDPKSTMIKYHHLIDDWYSFPYRALVPKDLDNVIAAGSCLSGEYACLAAWAIQVVCMLTGQAAGTAASICVKNNILPKDIDVSMLQNTLKEDGVFLG